MSRSARFFFWLRRVNALGVFLLLLVIAGVFAMELYRDYRYRQELEETKFGNAAELGPYAAETIETSDGEIAAYFQKDDSSIERREGSEITLVDNRTGKSRKIAGAASAWVLNWDLIYRDGDKGGIALGYLARIATEAQYDAGRFDLVVGNFPALEQKIVARDVAAMDLPVIHGDAGAAFVLWSETDKAKFMAIDLRDLTIKAQHEIDLPVVRDDRLSQAPGPLPAIPRADYDAPPQARDF